MFYCNGTKKGISWTIITGNKRNSQQRVHPEIFFDKVGTDEAKFIALHTGIFWGIGVFIIKNKDVIIVKTDLEEMSRCFYHLQVMQYLQATVYRSHRNLCLDRNF